MKKMTKMVKRGLLASVIVIVMVMSSGKNVAFAKPQNTISDGPIIKEKERKKEKDNYPQIFITVIDWNKTSITDLDLQEAKERATEMGIEFNLKELNSMNVTGQTWFISTYPTKNEL